MVPLNRKPMYNFDLKKVHDLISFKDICTIDSEYLKEASHLPHIELETDALYVLDPKMSVLFTCKLRYYRCVVESEINRHINAATKLLESDGSEELTKFILKKTRESVLTLAHEANRQLAFCDISGLVWKNFTSDNPTVSDFSKPVIEYVVYMHYIIAELARCWLELQDRYAYVIGTAGCYDVSLFYTANFSKYPDKEFEIRRSVKYDEESKNFKKCRTDCSFLYDNEEYFAIAIQEFTNKLKKHKLIKNTVDIKTMESLFRGRSCRTTIQWLGDNPVLTWIIKGLCSDTDPTVTTWPEGTSKWDVVSNRFLDKNGNPMTNDIRKYKTPKKKTSIVNELVKALADYK